MKFSDYHQIWLLTHGRTPTATGHDVGHFDDLLCLVKAGLYGWRSRRLDNVSPQYVRSQLSRDPYTLNIITDFIYTPSLEERNVMVFDHHDPGQPTEKCSAHLLMEELVRQGMLRGVPALMDQVSAWDVIGPNAVPVAHRPDPYRYTAILAAEPYEGLDHATAEFIWQSLEKSSSLRQLVDELFFSETFLVKQLVASTLRYWLVAKKL